MTAKHDQLRKLALFLLAMAFACGTHKREEETSELSLGVVGSTPLIGVGELPVRIPLGGRAVAVDVNPASPTTIAIVASESGGLFRSTVNFANWAHLDGFSPARVNDVKYVSSNGQLVIATAGYDLRNQGGIWKSPDGGTTWSKVSIALSCTQWAQAWGIAYSGNRIYVATDCGLVISPDAGASWYMSSLPSPTYSVLARGSIIDVCSTDGHRRSLSLGDPNTFGTVNTQIACGGLVHGIDGPGNDTNVIVAASRDGGWRRVRESDNGGVSWSLIADFTAGPLYRPMWVKVAAPPPAPRQNKGFDLWVHDGARMHWVTCEKAPFWPRCPFGQTVRDVNDEKPTPPWQMVVNVGHADINGIAMSQQCPALMVSDGGVYGSNDCGLNWAAVGVTVPDNPWHYGYNALQIYDIAGQIHPDASGPHTDFYFGTHDNNIWAAATDNGYANWSDKVSEGFALTAGHCAAASCGTWSGSTSDNDTVAGATFPGGTFISQAHFANYRGWTNPSGMDFLSYPTYVANGVFVEFAKVAATQAASLYAVQPSFSGGVYTGSWWPVTGPYSLAQGERLWTYRPVFGLGYIYLPTTRADGTVGLIRARQDPSNATIWYAERADTGLGSIAAYCPEPGAYVCPPVLGVDPSNGQRLMVADGSVGKMRYSTNGGNTWQDDIPLTNLITNNGQFPFTANIWAQPHTIGYDNQNGNRILVGTESAGIFSTVNGGTSWSKIPGSEKIPAVSGFFFDEFRQMIIVSSYGRGLWTIMLPILFEGASVQRSNRTGDWQPGYSKAECSDNEALVGVSRRTTTKYSHGALCRPSNINHYAHNACSTRNFASGNNRGTTITGDWDVGYYKGECAANEYVAGVSQSGSGDITSILCCVGSVTHQGCSKVVFETGNGQEDSSYGDWDPSFWKGSCGAGRYVGGMSRDFSSQPGSPHALLCCSP